MCLRDFGTIMHLVAVGGRNRYFTMRIDLSQKLQMRPELRLAPQMIQAIEILQLPTIDLRERIDQELESNPVLEIDERPREKEGAGDAQASEDHQSPPTAEELKREEKFDAVDRYFEDDRPRRRRDSGEPDRKMEAMANREARAATLQDHLAEQLGLLELSERQKELATYVINSIGSSGYLLYALSELLESLTPKYSTEEIKAALETVRALDPPGVGALDIQDCLLLQIDRLGVGHDLERELVSEYLEDIEYNRFPKIAKATGKSMDEIKEAVAFISTLTPRPGSAFGGTDPQYVVPDVVVEEIDGRYEIRLENSYIPPLRINTSYKALPKDSEAFEFLRRKQESARWLIESILQRQNTLQKICHEIFEYQKEFLDRGANFLRPLRMQEVADSVGVHISTVSRAIAAKYVQTPRGIFALRAFFSGATKSVDGAEGESQESVRQKLVEMIANEDKRYPLSDEDLRSKFREQGIDIARRTITKYRKALSIPSTRQRRQY